MASSDSHARFDFGSSSSTSTMPSLAASASASSFPFNSLIAAASATVPSTSLGRPLSSNSYSSSTPKPNTVALGRTRCYWSILSPSLDYIAVDPILDAHLKEQKDRFLGTNMLDYVHPDERDALRADLMPNPGRDGHSGIEQAGIFGSVTRCRYSRVPRIRQMLGATEPETDPEAKLIAYDSEYLSIDITTSWIGGGETGFGSGNGDELRGAVLAFFHATADKDEARDNDESRRSHWSNWCGPRSEDGGYLDQARCVELEAALARATSYNISSRHQSLSEGPPPHVFQIINTDGHPIVTFPPPSTPAHEYDPTEYAALGQQVVNKPRPSHESRTSCTRRYRDKHPLLKAGSLVSIESVVILYGAITFCVFDTGGIYLSAAAKQRAVSSASPASSSQSTTSSPRVSHAANKFELEDVPFLTPGQPKPFSFDYPEYPLFKRPRFEVPLGPKTPHDSLRLEVPQASSDRLSPPGDRRNGGLSPTVASSAAILGSLTGGPLLNPSTSPVHHPSPHLPPVQNLYRSPMQPPSAPYPAPPQPHYPFSHPATFGHPLYHQHPHMPAQVYPMYSQHSMAPQQHPMMHMATSHGYAGYPSPSLPPLGNPYGAAGGSLLSHQPHHMMQHPHLIGLTGSPHLNGDSSLPPARSGISEEGSSTQESSLGAASDPNGLNPGGAEFSTSTSTSTKGGLSSLSASTSVKKEKAPKVKTEPVANKPGPAACESCGTANSPEWRKGPSGNKSLCNACGLRYARQVSRAAKLAAAAASGEALPKKGKKSKKVKAAEAAIAEANVAAAVAAGGSGTVKEESSLGVDASLDDDSFFHAHTGAHHQDVSSSPQLVNQGEYQLPSMQANGGGGRSNGFDHPPPPPSHHQQSQPHQQMQHQQHDQQHQHHGGRHQQQSHSHHDFFGNGHTHAGFEGDQGQGEHGERAAGGNGESGGGEGQTQGQGQDGSRFRSYGF
ncbi:BQ5605_C033g11162 [Microbotryum silenes-dioicae]|uniref:BQ5605_C033g11162 protein n=1 Tax=Microbotryum silenes-dioicae TaxID=796604 RepID=A0A2X0PHX8_9BASI|nr:BQ5605_C033g11162 [Microbotryum silenes-dioicae]